MVKRGRHNSDGTAKNTGGSGKHGGPTTGTGHTGGRKPNMSEVQIPGVIGKAAEMAARILAKKKKS